MTEGRNIDAQTAAGFENGAAFVKLPDLIVYPGFDHALFTYGLVVQIATPGILTALRNRGSCGLSPTPNENFRSASAVVRRISPKTPGTSFAPQHLGQ